MKHILLHILKVCILAAEGFGVGHTRSTQTKGVWVWGEPQKLPPSAKTLQDSAGGQDASIVYLDTEGFESTGKADAYDDRIFALSTLISAVLVYNLPETVRESDIQKLSFAVELAEGFYADVQVHAYFCGLSIFLPAVFASHFCLSTGRSVRCSICDSA